MNEHNEGMEEKEYNDIESLAAYLHSGKMQEIKAAEERAGMGLPPEPSGSESVNGLESVLFTAEGIRRPAVPAAELIRPESYSVEEQTVKTKAPSHVIPDPTVPANPMMKAAGKSAAELCSEHKAAVKREKQASGSFTDNAKKKLGSLVSDAKGKLGGIKESFSKSGKDIEEDEIRELTEVTRKKPEAVRTEEPKKAEKPVKAVRANKHESAAKPEQDEVPALAASLSAALGEKAAELVEQQRNALPPEDVPEVFDIEEGTEQEEQFDNTATRLMNSVNDPHARSVSMKGDIEAEEEELRAERIQASRLRKNYERQKQSTRTLAYILVALLLCAAILGCAAYSSTYLVKWALDFTGVASQDFKIDVTIPDDADIETVAAILSENNIINDAKFFKFYADFADKLKQKENKNKNTDFIGGKYTVSSTMSYSTLLSILRTKVTEKKTVSVRIIEGMTAHEIGELLEENYVCFADDFEKYYKNIQNTYDFERRVKENPLKFNQLEGYLFPDTYEFYVVNSMETGGRPSKNETVEEAYEKMKKESEDNALEAAKKMYSNFNSKITRGMYKKMGEMHFTLDDTIAIASLVQREAASEEDMGMVASVFLNRIRNSETYPYLQSDVSTVYIENDIKPFITGSDASKQRICDAYNTYTTEGIPPGGLCNPGISAINAVLYAPETPYLYFCANEETGEIYYATTLAEHEENLVTAGLVGSIEEAEALEERING